jgi:2-oxoglutarate dehydrogenase E2 component (dihydrolipoamide succinyltransferase)
LPHSKSLNFFNQKFHMAQTEILMPKMGESVFEATIVKCLKKIGDKVNEDDSIVEIATDKVDSEVPSSVEGTLQQWLCKEGDVVKVGSPIAVISTDKDEENEKSVISAIKTDKATEQLVTKIQPTVAATIDEPLTNSNRPENFISPLVKNIAKEEGISWEQLNKIQGTGAGGRITKKDILAFVPNKEFAFSQSNQKAAVVGQKPSVSVNSGDEIIEMDRMRKLISEHMTMSKHTSAHVTSFVEVDVTNIVLWREKVRAEFEEKEGEKLTFTPIFIQAIARAIKEFPMINISVDGDKIIKHKRINVGMAAALPSGNLIVPVIKDADMLSLTGITKKVNDLAARARNNKLTPDEIQGGTYTLTNVGTFGNIMGTPIINQPQVAIMAVGTIKKKPAVIETEYGDVIGIRHFMYLSHTYDHRVVDGSLGGQFVKKVADILEHWNINELY